MPNPLFGRKYKVIYGENLEIYQSTVWGYFKHPLKIVAGK